MKSTLARDHGPYSANHTMRLLRHMFNLAADWGLFRGDNPARRVQLFRETKRERFLTPAELARVNQALLAETDWRWRAFFPLALMLGFRKGELCALRWVDVDFAQRTLRLPHTKAGRAHLLPLPAPVAALWNPCRAAAAVTGYSRATARPVISWSPPRPGYASANVRASRTCGFTTCVTLWRLGWSLRASACRFIGRALNHSQLSTTERYAHLALDPLRAALDLNAAKMLEVAPELAGK